MIATYKHVYAGVDGGTKERGGESRMKNGGEVWCTQILPYALCQYS